MLQVCNGVAYMHSQNISHRDLKVENILYLNEEFKIADFGSCTRDARIDYHQTSKEQVQAYLSQIETQSTHMYRAPELLDQYNSPCADERSDVWALGCLMYLLATCKHPF